MYPHIAGLRDNACSAQNKRNVWQKRRQEPEVAKCRQCHYIEEENHKGQANQVAELKGTQKPNSPRRLSNTFFEVFSSFNRKNRMFK